MDVWLAGAKKLGEEFLGHVEVTFYVGVLALLFIAIVHHIPFAKDRKNFRVVHDRVYLSRESIADLLFWTLNFIFVVPSVFIYSKVLALALDGVPENPLADFIRGLPFAAQILCALLALDIALYIRHRFVHTFAWPYHTVHHVAHEITWTTTDKLHPGDTIIMGFVGTLVLFFLGFEGEAMTTAITIQLFVNVFNHSNIELDYPGVLRYIFVSPNMHRWHHAIEPEAHHKNFAIMFAFLDVLGRSFYVPKGRLPSRYGVLDEDGNDVVDPERWPDLMLYPLKKHKEFVMSLFRRGT